MTGVQTCALPIYIINAIDLARKVGMGGRTNTTMQAAFFKLANLIPYDDADKYMKEKVVASYGKKGEDVVKMNFAAIDAALTGLEEVEIPADWATTTEGAVPAKVPGTTDYFDEFIAPVLAQEGNKLPVSKLDPRGIVPTGTTKFEKRGIDRKSTRLNSSHNPSSRMPSSAWIGRAHV